MYSEIYFWINNHSLMPNHRKTEANSDETLKHWSQAAITFNHFVTALHILICYYILTTKKSSQPVKKKSQWSKSEHQKQSLCDLDLLMSLGLSLNFSFVKEKLEAKPWRLQKDQWLSGVEGMNRASTERIFRAGKPLCMVP